MDLAILKLIIQLITALGTIISIIVLFIRFGKTQGEVGEAISYIKCIIKKHDADIQEIRKTNSNCLNTINEKLGRHDEVLKDIKEDIKRIIEKLNMV